MIMDWAKKNQEGWGKDGDILHAKIVEADVEKQELQKRIKELMKERDSMMNMEDRR
eukprot:UN12642